MRKVIFIGPRGLGKNLPKTGSSIKNYFIYDYLSSQPIELIGISTSRWKRRPWVLLSLITHLLLNRSAKVVVSTSFRSAYIFIKLISLLINPQQIVYWVIGGALAEKIKKNRFDLNVYQRIDKVIVEGEVMREELESIGISNVKVVPNFKKIDYLPKLDDFIGNSGEVSCKFVFLSRIIPEKGCDLIINVCRQLNQEGFARNFTVDFYGNIDSDYKTDFIEKIQKLPNASYKGFLDLRNQKNYDELARYSIFLFPTYWSTEGFPGIIIDAMISGLPVIASDWNLNKDLVKDGETGIIVPARNETALYEAMKACIENPEVCENMRCLCQQHAMDYDIRRVLSNDFLFSLGLLTEQG